MQELACGDPTLIVLGPSGDWSERAPASIRLVRVRVPLITAHSSAHGSESTRDVVLVAWRRIDGTEGWSECPTLQQAGYATESTDVAWAGLLEELAPAALSDRMPVVSGLIAASSAMADAALDAELRASRTSLADHLGATRRSSSRGVVIADLAASPAEAAARAVEAVRGGAALVKVKIAPGADVDQLRAVIAAVGDTPVAADANGTYDDPAALGAVDDLGLSYIEQPFPAAATWDELATMKATMSTPVALDESLTSPDAVRSAILAGAADVISVKPARLGGVVAAAVVVDFAAGSGVDVFVGGMVELGLGRAAAAAVAALPGCTLPTDLGPSDQYFRHDICERVVVDERGRLVVPTGPGSGRTPDPAALAEFAVEDVTLTR